MPHALTDQYICQKLMGIFFFFIQVIHWIMILLAKKNKDASLAN